MDDINRTLGVWRVYNGSVGACDVHRIVVCYTSDVALMVATKAGMKLGTGAVVERICDAVQASAEAQDFEG